MTEPVFEIHAPGVDVERVVAEIQATVAQRMQEGYYKDARVARAERSNLANIRDADTFLAFYLDCLRDAVYVDISDFEIRERRARFTAPLILLKKLIWGLLKFYTYRLWSQQNLVNGLLLSAVEGTESRCRERIEALEARIAALEAREKQTP